MILVDSLRLTRVLYVDALVPADAVGLSAEEVDAVTWNDDRWSSSGQVRAGAAAWVVSDGAEHVVLDPFLAADEIFHDPASAAGHQEAITSAFAVAGVGREQVTRVVVSHIEGIGMIAVRDGEAWTPFFPNARVSIGEAALSDFRSQPGGHWSSDAWQSLLDAHLVDTFADADEIMPGMRAQHTGLHNPGHYMFHFGDTPTATFLGHLATSPLHLSTGPCAAQHLQPDAAWEMLHDIAADGRLLIGPLWPSPGAGRWTGSAFEPFAWKSS